MTQPLGTTVPADTALPLNHLLLLWVEVQFLRLRVEEFSQSCQVREKDAAGHQGSTQQVHHITAKVIRKRRAKPLNKSSSFSLINETFIPPLGSKRLPQPEPNLQGRSNKRTEPGGSGHMRGIFNSVLL